MNISNKVKKFKTSFPSIPYTMEVKSLVYFQNWKRDLLIVCNLHCYSVMPNHLPSHSVVCTHHFIDGLAWAKGH